MKLVITGHDGSGRSVFHHAGAPSRTSSPGSLWSTRGALVVPDATPANAPAEIGYFPVDGETAFKVVTVPPASERGDPIDVSMMPPDIAHHFDREDPEMHTTDTIDYVVIASGAADLELDDGVRERVEAGDCVVQIASYEGAPGMPGA